MSHRVIMRLDMYDKDTVLMALEAGVHGVIVPDSYLEEVQSFARCAFYPCSIVSRINFHTKDDELDFAHALRQTDIEAEMLTLQRGWEIIPVENLLAQSDIAHKVCLEVANLDEARLALGILERGVDTLIVLPEAMPQLREIINLSVNGLKSVSLEKAIICDIHPVGLGHRVCVDTMSVLKFGQGMLTGNSSGFTFLVHAETQQNTYVNARPFRINAGAVHAYAMMPEDKTAYLEEISAGTNVLIVNVDGTCESAVVGRVKVEIRPMLYLEAVTKDGKEGSVFLQNAETICLMKEDGTPVSVVNLQIGDEILCHLDEAGRHFGMRIQENITE